MAGNSSCDNVLQKQLFVVHYFIKMQKEKIEIQEKQKQDSYLLDGIKKYQKEIDNLDNEIETKVILEKYMNNLIGKPLPDTKNNNPMGCSGAINLQVDEYVCERTKEINKAAFESIREVVADVNSQTDSDNGFNGSSEELVAKRSEEKSNFFIQADDERNARQELILQTGFKRMRDLIEEARSKFDVLGKAQAQSSAGINQTTERVFTLEQEDASRCLASTTTTVITTKSTAANETDVEGSRVVLGETKTQVKSSYIDS